MPLRTITSAVVTTLALSLGFAALAQAQPHGGDRRGPPPGQHYGPQHGPGARHPGPPPRMHHGHRPPPPHMVRGAGPDHRWVKGSRVPPQYRSRHYVVNDWRGHHLRQPPRGYHWVQYGSDYLLVAIASGVISQLIIHGMH